ncbi:uncharacterized protein LODBEIA_P22500 [Lodderomyces beijingensis]|uniref:MMS19 nucleotide excision repair protein n=1 Tax=Lodderomyces beijingensis TaxID=1775926 RepID=A0ABP0ZMC0_9ASCO
MSNVHNVPILINQYVAAAGNDEQACQAYVSEVIEMLSTKEVTLLQFIQKLGPTLTSEQGLVRSKAMSFMAHILRDLQPTSQLSRQDVTVLIDFLMTKFNDELSLIHALNGLNSLIRSKNYMAKLNTGKILAKLNDAYDPKKNLAKVRYEAFQILSGLMENHLEVVQRNDSDDKIFVKTFIHIASGEKDPRNLLLSFKLNKEINEKIFDFDEANESHEDLITDLFDVCFCYFPISFTPPANDPYKITASELKEKLRLTIASQSGFAPDAFSGLVEKLASTNPAIRKDTLKTINLCVENYSAEALEAQWSVLWSALKFEILHNDAAVFKANVKTIIPTDIHEIDDNDDVKVVFLTMTILESLIRKVKRPADMLRIVIDELRPNLTSEKSSKQSVIILSILASTSVENYNAVVDTLFQYKTWGKYFNVEDEVEEEKEGDEGEEEDKNADFSLNVARQRDLVDNLGFVLTAYPVSGKTHLSNYKDHILLFLCQLLTNSSHLEKTLRVKAVQQSIKLISLPQFLTITNVELILDNFRRILEENLASQVTTDMVSSEIVKGLSEIMEENPAVTSLVIEKLVNPLLNSLNAQEVDKKEERDNNNDNENENEDEEEGEEDGDEDNSYKAVLSIIGDLCVNYQVLEVLSIRLVSKSNVSAKRFQLIVETLASLIEKVEIIHQFLTNSWYQTFLPRFLATMRRVIGDKSTNYVLVEAVGDLVRLIIRFIDVAKHQALLDEFHKVFFTQSSSNSTKVFHYDGDLLETPTVYISIFNKILSAIDKSCQLDTAASAVASVVKLIPGLTSGGYVRVQYLENLCLLVNKFQTGTQPINWSFDDLNSFEIDIWTLKALLLKIDASGIESLKKLLAYLTDDQATPRQKQLIARSLPILFIDINLFTNPPLPKKVISKVTNLNVKLLYKQHVFEIVLPYLLESSPDANTPPREFELKFFALSLIVENVSTKILISHLTQFLPSVFKALRTPVASSSSSSSSRSIICKSSLRILRIILEQDNQQSTSMIKPNLSELITILLKFATGGGDDGQGKQGESIRLLSLSALGLLFEKFDCERHRKYVLKNLEKCLDDNRRLIRKSATDLRQKLYEMR